MFKLSLIVWIILSGTFAGIALLVVLATPSLAAQAWKLAPISIGIGVLLSLPVSWYVAKQILATQRVA
jgi:hypothetical protein